MYINRPLIKGERKKIERPLTDMLAEQKKNIIINANTCWTLFRKFKSSNNPGIISPNQLNNKYKKPKNFISILKMIKHIFDALRCYRNSSKLSSKSSIRFAEN